MGTSTKAPTTPPCLSRVEDKQEMTPKDRTKTKAADQTTERAAGKKKRIIAKFVAMDNDSEDDDGVDDSPAMSKVEAAKRAGGNIRKRGKKVVVDSEDDDDVDSEMKVAAETTKGGLRSNCVEGCAAAAFSQCDSCGTLLCKECTMQGGACRCDVNVKTGPRTFLMKSQTEVTEEPAPCVAPTDLFSAFRSSDNCPDCFDYLHSIARILPAHPAPGPTIDFAYIAPYAHSIPKSPKRIARNLSNAHCAQYAKQPIARYMHFGQNNIARNAQNAYSAVYAFWPKIHCAVYAFWPKTHCAQSAKPTKNTSQARNMHLFMSTIVIVGPGAAYATFVISCILRAMRT